MREGAGELRVEERGRGLELENMRGSDRDERSEEVISMCFLPFCESGAAQSTLNKFSSRPSNAPANHGAASARLGRRPEEKKGKRARAHASPPAPAGCIGTAQPRFGVIRSGHASGRECASKGEAVRPASPIARNPAIRKSWMDPAESSWLGEAAKKSLAVAPHGSKTLPPASTHHSGRHLERGISNAAMLTTLAAASAASTSALPVASTSSASLSFARDAYIQPGDLVIIFASRDKTPMPLTVTPGEHACRTAARWSRSADAATSTSFDPTPELWTLALPHRTQILYAPDMSFISMKLNMGPGSRVIEAGTGSGSFSHFIARCVGRADAGTGKAKATSAQMQVPRNWGGLPNDLQQNLSRGRGQPRDTEDEAAPTDSVEGTPGPKDVQPDTDAHVPEEHGRVWSFEFHEPRAHKARAEFAAHGMDKVIVLNHRNVCKDGFGLTDAADSVFLDLPAPWEAVGHAVQALRRDVVTRICCFSPCIEQVLKTVTALNEHGFTDVETFESLVRTHESHASAGPQVSIDEAVNRIRVVEQRKESRRLIQIEKARAAKAHAQANDTDSPQLEAGHDASTTEGETLKRKHEGIDASEQDDGAEAQAPTNGTDTDAAETPQQSGAEGSFQRGIQGGVAITKKKARLLQIQSQQNQPIQPASVFSRPFYEMRGHTSYLTFATLLPRKMTGGL
ncbi:hypothetical protein L1887_52992 [Cichorium endivia]|nr:hypothetical protein L1887_52992 [Cichorium endivia]